MISTCHLNFGGRGDHLGDMKGFIVHSEAVISRMVFLWRISIKILYFSEEPPVSSWERGRKDKHPMTNANNIISKVKKMPCKILLVADVLMC